MFAINHAATALVVKKKYPEAPMWLLLISVQLIELLWVFFNFLGIEYSTIENKVSSVADIHLTHMPYSHSILSTIIAVFFAWFVICKVFNKPKIAVATSIAIASHLVLDLLTHNQDIALAPFMDLQKIGLGLYSIPLLAFVIETLYGIFCWWIYKGSKLLVATIVGFNLANFTLFSSAVIGPEAWLANNPMLLTTLIFMQIIVTLVLVGKHSQQNTKNDIRNPAMSFETKSNVN